MATNTPEAAITSGTIKSDRMTTHMLAPATEQKAVQIAMLSEINSPLLRLPTELRLLIFEYAVHCPGIEYKAKNNKAASHLRIISTSRQIFRETADLFYSTNTFSLRVWQIENFVQALPEVGRQVLRHVKSEEPSMELYFGSWAPRLEDLYECSAKLPALKTVEIQGSCLKGPWWRYIVRIRGEILDSCVGRQVLSKKVLESDQGPEGNMARSVKFELV